MAATCLVVDDSPTVRRALSQIVANLGFEVETAKDGAAACALASRSMPSVVLLDWNMPVMDGLECLIRLRAMPGGEAPAVVFCSSVNDAESIAQTLASGANEYIMKPFDAGIVREKLERCGALSP